MTDMFTRGILGMNKRNNIYVKEFNPDKGIRLAKNKFATKRLLLERSIPVPQTYGYYTTIQSWLAFDVGQFASAIRSFVIKPNHGSKGNGISIVSDVRKRPRYTNSKKKRYHFLKDGLLSTPLIDYGYEFFIGGKRVSETTLKKKMLGIFNGAFSSTGKGDTILIEEKIIPGSGFDIFCQHGLADIRVIVFNLVPLIAMLRVPTEESDGKANLAQGGIGLGIDITTGKVKTLYRKGKSYTKDFPQQYSHFENKTISYRKEILEYSVDTQYFINSGYLGMDRVVTANGPKLLEVNGRAGLEIQNITGTPLLHHMKKIEDIRINSPTKGLEISKSLFGKEKISEARPQNTLYLSQAGRLSYLRDEKNRSLAVTINVDLTNKKNYASAKVIKKLLGVNQLAIDLGDGSMIRAATGIKFELSNTLQGNTISLGQDILQNYYILPRAKSTITTKIFKVDALDKTETISLQLLDEKLSTISKSLNLQKFLRPTNYLTEFDRFVEKRGDYNPQFHYNFPSYQTLQSRKVILQDLDARYRQKNYFHSSVAELFYEKIDELYYKIELIRAYKQQHYENILIYNHMIFGEFDSALLHQSKLQLQQSPRRNYLHAQPLRAQEVKQYCLAYLREHGINYKVVIETINSRMSVIPGSLVKINTHISISLEELNGLLAHEIGVHIRRYENGKKTGRQILRSGTAHYVMTEEGLAVYRAEQEIQKINENYTIINPYGKYMLAHYAQHSSFSDCFGYLHGMDGYYNPGWNYKTLFNKILKQKKGLQDTSQVGGYIKDKVYLEGYAHIKSLTDLERNQLMLGKIKLSDLKYFSF